MLQKLRNRTPRAAKRPFEFNLDRFELGLSLEEIMADLNYGVGPIAETAQSVHDDRPQVGTGYFK